MFGKCDHCNKHSQQPKRAIGRAQAGAQGVMKTVTVSPRTIGRTLNNAHARTTNLKQLRAVSYMCPLLYMEDEDHAIAIEVTLQREEPFTAENQRAGTTMTKEGKEDSKDGNGHQKEGDEDDESNQRRDASSPETSAASAIPKNRQDNQTELTPSSTSGTADASRSSSGSDIPPAMSIVNLTYKPMKTRDYQALPVKSYEDEVDATFELDNYEDRWRSVDPVDELWRGVTHMCTERSQHRILGSQYLGPNREGEEEGGKSSAPLLMDILRDFHADFVAAKPVALYFSNMEMADEFSCPDTEGNGIGAATSLINELSTSKGPLLGERQKGGPRVKQMVVEGVTVSVEAPRQQYEGYRVSAEDGSRVHAVSPQTKDELVKRLDVDTQRLYHGQSLRDRLHWLRTEADLSNLRDVWFPELGGKYVREGEGGNYYGWLAWVAGEAMVRLFVDTLIDYGIAHNEMLRWVWEYLGLDEGAMFAACGGGGTGLEAGGRVQVGVTGLGYSAFSELENDHGGGDGVEHTDDLLDVRVTVGLLRRVGRMGYTDNVLRGVPSAGGRQFVVKERTNGADGGGGGGRWVIASEGEPDAEITMGTLDNDTIVG